jgi:hypothetical protein
MPLQLKLFSNELAEVEYEGELYVRYVLSVNAKLPGAGTGLPDNHVRNR